MVLHTSSCSMEGGAGREAYENNLSVWRYPARDHHTSPKLCETMIYGITGLYSRTPLQSTRDVSWRISSWVCMPTLRTHSALSQHTAVRNHLACINTTHSLRYTAYRSLASGVLSTRYPPTSSAAGCSRTMTSTRRNSIGRCSNNKVWSTRYTLHACVP